MLEFLKKQVIDIEQELQELIANRAKVGVLVIGQYQVKIEELQKERRKLLKEIAEEEKNISTPIHTYTTSNITTPKPKKLKSELRDLVAMGQLSEALQKAHRHYDNDDTFILLLAQFNRLNRDQRVGIIEASTYSVRLAQITNGFLSHLNTL